MKYIEKTYNKEYSVSLSPFGDDVSEFDKVVFEKIASDKSVLFEKAENYINEVIDTSKPMFEGGLILNAINIAGTSERSYHVEMECYYENDNHMYWSVTYNVPLAKTDEESLSNSRYWPIELKRRVE